MLRNPRFDEERLGVEKGKTLEAMKQRNDDADDILAREWAWLLYGREHFERAGSTAARARGDRPRRPRRLPPPDLGCRGSGHRGLGRRRREGRSWPNLGRRLAGWPRGRSAAVAAGAPEFTPAPGRLPRREGHPAGQGRRSATAASRSTDWADPELVRDRGDERHPRRRRLHLAADEADPLRRGARLRRRLELRRRRLLAGASSAWATPRRTRRSPTPWRSCSRSSRGSGASRSRRRSSRIAKSSFDRHLPARLRVRGADRGHLRAATSSSAGRTSYWNGYRERIEAVTADGRARGGEASPATRRSSSCSWSANGREIAPGDPEGRAKMAQFGGGQVEHLPLRDPLTLAPLPAN